MLKSLVVLCLAGAVITLPLVAAAAEMGWVGLGVRVGYAEQNLKAASVPFVGSKLTKILNDANNTIDRNNASRGTNQPHYVMRDLNLQSSMLEVTPSIHLGGDGYFTKLEFPIGLSAALKTIGFGVYPVNFGLFIPGTDLFPYGSAGLVFNYATSSEFTPTQGAAIKVNAKGGVFEARLALGLKSFVADSLAVGLELGYSPFALGAVVDGNNVKVGPDGFPEHPGAVVRGGMGSVFTLLASFDWL